MAQSYERLARDAPAGGQARRRYAAEAARWWDRHHELFFSWWRHPDPTWQEYQLAKDRGLMAWLAFEAGDAERARGWSQEAARIPEVLARMPPGPGPPLDPWPAHMGNVVLGRLALARGDLDEAERRLGLAGQHPPGAHLSRTPDLELASGMLERDRPRSVVSYLEACRDMWMLGEEQIDRWVAEIRAGQRPRLDPHSIKPSLQLQMKVLRRVIHEFGSLRAHLKNRRRNR